jgi:hypothetical protein
MSDVSPSENALLGQILPDPTTGLPSLLYFRLVLDWEERRARRLGTRVRVIKLVASGGTAADRRSLPKKLCRELRETDLIASHGPMQYHLLLTSPDAEKVDVILERIRLLVESINRRRRPTKLPLAIDARVEDERILYGDPGPCEPCDVDHLSDSGEGPRFLE